MGGSFEKEFQESGGLKKYLLALKSKCMKDWFVSKLQLLAKKDRYHLVWCLSFFDRKVYDAELRKRRWRRRCQSVRIDMTNRFAMHFGARLSS
jgi:hypothetical protein